jgi:hypothetical protein
MHWMDVATIIHNVHSAHNAKPQQTHIKTSKKKIM